MKRFLCLLLSLLLTLSLCACGQQAADRTAGMDPAATATDENGETISYSTSYYVDTGDWIPAYYNRHFSMCGDVISFPLEDGKILQFLNLDDQEDILILSEAFGTREDPSICSRAAPCRNWICLL